MRVEDLTEFVVLATYMNFSKAAAQLHLSQPTLSKHIALLEKELGTQLIVRSKPLRLTPSGTLFLESAQKIKTVIDREMGTFRKALSSNPPVRLLGFEFFSCEDFLKTLADLPLSFVLSTGSEGYLAALLNDVADINVTFDISDIPTIKNQAQDNEVDIIPIGKTPGAFLVSKGHHLARRKHLTRRDLKDARIAIIDRGPFDDWSQCVSHFLGGSPSFVLKPIDGNFDNLKRMSFDTETFFMQRAIIDRIVAARDDVQVFYELDGEPIRLPLALLYRKDNPNPNVREFANRAHAFFESTAALELSSQK